ncbi:MAG: TonB-dependent receptor [Flavipsychrobacter sp.]|nr:TonB-dependent receptor [Flavipsychrobacter sp.]
MRLLVVIALLLINSTGFSQSKGSNKIEGKIVDSITGNPIEYATIVLIENSLGKTVDGATADSLGKFKLMGVPIGSYSLVVDFIGYHKATINVNILESKQTASPYIIHLSPLLRQLKSVTITASAPVFESKIDKMIYNAANDVTAQGGIALDVLKKVPQVAVDIDGNVELQGNGNIRFLINGKPSTMFGNSLTDALSSIPASQIKSIEVITVPGAKYDAQGTAGIINIILKETKVQGMSGSVNASGGTLLENGSLNLSYRHNKWGLTAFYSGNARLPKQTYSHQDRSFADSANRIGHVIQDGSLSFDRNGYQSGLTFDWDVNEKNNIGMSIGYEHFSNHTAGITKVQDIDGYSGSSTDITRSSDNHSFNNSIEASFSYKRRFARKEQELNFSATSSYGLPSMEFFQHQEYINQQSPFAGIHSKNMGKEIETNISLDYTHPVNDDIAIETGLKTIIETIGSDANVYMFNTVSYSYQYDASQSYSLTYLRNIYAGYLSGTFTLLHYLNVKAGARYEHTDTRIDFPGLSVPPYETLVPSIIFSHSFKKQTVKLAYTRRIERPDYREINPFLNVSDPYNISTGNPLLKPEIGDNIEFGYSRPIGSDGNLYIAIFERINSQDIKPYTTFFPTYMIGDSIYTNVTVSSRTNIGTEQNTGVSVSGSVPLFKHMKLRGNIMAANRHIINSVDGNIINSLSCRANVNLNYTAPKDWVFETFCDYRSPFNNIQGKQPQVLTYTFALRKQLLQKKLSFGLTVSNVFNKYIRELTTINTDSYTSYSFRKVPYRSVGISLSYRFGRLEFKKGKEDVLMQNNSQVD